MEARTLKYIFYGLLALDLIANLITVGAYFWLKTISILIVMGIFDMIIIIPITVIFGIYVLLVSEGQKLKNNALAENFFKNVPISTKK